MSAQDVERSRAVVELLVGLVEAHRDTAAAEWEGAVSEPAEKRARYEGARDQCDVILWQLREILFNMDTHL